MDYNNYTVQEVFSSALTNNICNIITGSIKEAFPGNFATDFCLTGTVAKIINGASATPVKVIPFITSDLKIFNYFKTEISKKLGVGAITFSDRIQLNYNGIYFEMWLTNDIGTINTVTTLQVQATADIPSNIN